MKHALAFLALLLGACGSAPEESDLGAKPQCVPNHQIECACPGGAMGVRVCRADGLDYGACDCSVSTSCSTASNCFDDCLCQGGDGKTCLDQCAGGGGDGGSASGGASGSAAGGTSSGGYGATGGSSGVGDSGSGSGSGSGTGGSSGGGCQACVSQACPGELQNCAQTPGCLELVGCAEQSGCWLDDYACLLMSCGSYLLSFGAVEPAISLGSCVSNACAGEC